MKGIGIFAVIFLQFFCMIEIVQNKLGEKSQTKHVNHLTSSRCCKSSHHGFNQLSRSTGSSCPLTTLCAGLSHFSRVWLFVTLWTVAQQAPLSMGFSWQEYWSRLPSVLLQQIFPTQGLNPSLMSPALAEGFFTLLVLY